MIAANNLSGLDRDDDRDDGDGSQTIKRIANLHNFDAPPPGLCRYVAYRQIY